MSMHTLLYFLGASMALTLAPGPDNVFVITQGISRGKRVAIVTALGMCSGVTVHTTAAALGVSVIFHTSALAFQAVKYAGATYLLYLAYKTLRERGALTAAPDMTPSLRAVFRRGFIMNVLNPKVALFFLAFLPQFASREAGPIAPQMFVLGLIFMLQAAVLFSIIAVFAGAIGDYVLKRPAVSRGLAWASAGVMASLGLRLAFAQR